MDLCKTFVTLFVFAILALGCDERNAASSKPLTDSDPANPKVYRLTIVGYNYTKRYINTFSVEGNGGGNLMVSGPSSGGGGSVCCAPFVKGIIGLTVPVRWQYSACVFHVESPLSHEVTDQIHPFFKEVEAKVTENYQNEPKYMEVHFYPEGKIEVAVTEVRSAPRLILKEEREDRSHYVRCPNDKEPT